MSKVSNIASRSEALGRLGRSALTGKFVMKPATNGGTVSVAKVRRAIRSVVAGNNQGGRGTRGRGKGEKGFQARIGGKKR